MILMNTLMMVMIAVMTIKVRFMKLTTGTSESGFLKLEK